MFVCPACGRNAVTAFSKLFATAHSPAVCRACGAMSAEPPAIRRFTRLWWGLLPLALIAWFLLSPQSLGMMWIPVAVLAVFEFILFLRLPLRTLANGQVARSRVYALFVLVGFLIAAVIIAVLGSR